MANRLNVQNIYASDSQSTPSVTLDSSGNVGIGAPTPWSLLDVRGTAGNANLNTLTLQNDDYGANETGQAITQLFRLNRAGTMRDAASIKVGKDSDWDDAANADSHLIFSTTLNDTLTERMRIDSSGNVQLTGSLTAGTLGSGVTFPTGHMIFRELQNEYQPNSQTGLTATNVATTLSVTPLSTTSQFIFNIFGACSTGVSTPGYGGQADVTPKYSLNSDMSSATSGSVARAHYFNNDSTVGPSQDISNAAGAFYSSTVITHSGNTYYFNVDLTLQSGSRAYFRNINMQIIEVF